MQLRLPSVCQMLIAGFLISVSCIAIPIKVECDRAQREYGRAQQLKLEVEWAGGVCYLTDSEQGVAGKIAGLLGSQSPRWLRKPDIQVDLVSSLADDQLLSRLQPYLNHPRLNLSESRITGVGLTSAAQLSRVTEVHSHSAPITNAGLKMIAQIPRLEQLSLSDHKISGVGFQSLENCRDLKNLFLCGANVDDECLKHIRRIPNLRELYLNETRVSNAGLRQLRGHPNIAHLQFFKTRIELNDSALADLGTLPSLEFLDLSDRNITDVGLVHLSGCKGLKDLRLNGTRISDAGLSSLKSLTKLQSLYLDRTQITDEGLKQLKSLTNLKYLSLSGLRRSEIFSGGMVSREYYRQHCDPGCIHVTDAGLEHLVGIPSLTLVNVYGTRATGTGIRLLEIRRPSLHFFGP